MAKYYVDECFVNIDEYDYKAGRVGGRKYRDREGYWKHRVLYFIEDKPFDSIDEIGQTVADHFGITYNPDDLLLCDHDIPGRLDFLFRYAKTPDGTDPTKEDMERFKAGEISLYCLDVAVRVLRVKKSPYRFKQLVSALTEERAKQTA